MTIPLVPNLEEVAVVATDNLAWSNWETVMVQHRYMDFFPIFEFSAIEPATEPAKVAKLLFRPGQRVTITLGGILAITGVITIRQSAMDKERHGLQVIGKGVQWQAAKSSIIGPNGGGYDFSGKNIFEIAQTIAGETGVNVKEVGSVDHTPFPVLTVPPGMSVFDFLEEACRMRNTVIGADEIGNLLLIGPHTPNTGADLIEGKNGNIERIRVVIKNETLFANYWATGQMQGSDDINGEAASQMVAGPVPGNDALTSNLMVSGELPGYPGDLQKRAAWEAQIHAGTEITIEAMVKGWRQKPGGDLWRVGNVYTVDAPDHLPDEWNKQGYAAQTVTFQQDDENGTTTTLQLVLPWLLNGNYFNVPGSGVPGLPQSSIDVTYGSTTSQPSGTGP